MTARTFMFAKKGLSHSATVFDHKAQEVAHVVSDKSDEENLRLAEAFAAAPELIKVLEQIVEKSRVDYSNPNAAPMAIGWIRSAAEQALRKVKGAV